MESIEITDRAAAQVSRGMLWIFSNEIHKKPASFPMGAWCHFHCRQKMVATGYANPHSLIFGRVVALGAHDDISKLLRERLTEAFARRAGLGPSQAARLVYSEADFLPGLVIDVYADRAVLQSNTAGIDNALPILELLVPEFFEKTFHRKLKGLVIKADSGIRKLEGIDDFTKVVSGDKADLENVDFEEGGTKFAANLIDGQKTGFFLDQRDNRTFLANLIAGHSGDRVLDLCSYTGGWGLRALTAGAAHVTFVDESAAAGKLIDAGLGLNNMNKSKARFAASDVFDFLEKDSGAYDVIIADPPAFVKSKKNLPQAMKAYEKLNRLAWRRLKEGGVLLSCSCSFHLAEPDFVDLLKNAVGKEKGMARMIYRGGQASDHPVLLSMPETRYLKCVGLQKLHAVSN